MIVNSWRIRFIVEIDDKCCMCALAIPKTIAMVLGLWNCKESLELSIGIIDSMKAQKQGPQRAFWWPISWIPKKKISTSLSKCWKIYLLLRGITGWTIWVEKNDLTFNNNEWDARVVKQMIWASTFPTMLEVVKKKARRERPRSKMTSLSSSTQRRAGTTSSTIDRILKQCGTIVHPMSVELNMLRLFTLHGVVRFHLVYPSKFPCSLFGSWWPYAFLYKIKSCLNCPIERIRIRDPTTHWHHTMTMHINLRVAPNHSGIDPGFFLHICRRT